MATQSGKDGGGSGAGGGGGAGGGADAEHPPSKKARFYFQKIAVIGAGSYGTAIATVIARARKHSQVVIYTRHAEQAEGTLLASTAWLLHFVLFNLT